MNPSVTWPLHAVPATTNPARTKRTNLGAIAIDDTPVLAFGSGLTALGVLRSLHGSGITVYSVCPPADLVARSRWYRPVPGYNGSCPDPSQLEEFLSKLPIRHAVLIPCSDDWARAIASRPEEMKASYPASVADRKVIETMTDKWRFANFVECANIPRPRTAQVESMNQLESLPESLFQGAFLKPVDSQEFARYHHVKAYRIQNKNHALEIMRKVLDEGGCGFPILLQEFIPGDASHYYLVDGFVDRHGETQALIARRRLSQYPPHFGNSARSQTIPLESVAGAVESLQKMWATMRYRGIFDAEFKYDHRDGQLKILEINARPWWFVEFATRCDVDLCRMAYLDALELPVKPTEEYQVGRTCVHLNYDLAAHMTGNVSLPNLIRWFRSAKGVEDIIYRWDDPWPGLYSTFGALRSYLRRRSF